MVVEETAEEGEIAEEVVVTEAGMEEIDDVFQEEIEKVVKEEVEEEKIDLIVHEGVLIEKDGCINEPSLCLLILLV